MSEKEEPEIIQVGPIDTNKKNSPIKEGPPPEEEAEVKGGTCYFNGVAYSEGAYVCSERKLLRCYYDNTWWAMGRPC